MGKILLVSAILSVMVTAALAVPRPQIYCHGVDYYGDVTWTLQVYHDSAQSFVVYTEMTGLQEPFKKQIRKPISQGRIELPSPGMLARVLYHLSDQRLEFLDYKTNRAIHNPFDEFSCRSASSFKRKLY